MPADLSVPEPRTRWSGRAAVMRSSALRAAISPGAAAAYVLATWSGPNRPVMLAVTAVMLAGAAVMWWRALSIVRSPALLALQVTGMLVNIVGSAVLTLADGGVHSPLGAILAFNLIVYAVMMPSKRFPIAAGLTAVAYWTVARLGEPAPPGYVVVYTLGIAGVAYICMRHAAALASLRRRLAEVSRVDPLTRSLNRRGFDERLEQEVAEAARTGEPVTLVVADLDRFKDVNDTYGHQAGDDLLAWTARTMTQELRQHDAVGRLGGDEFGAVLADTGPDDARAVVQRLRSALEGVAPAGFGQATYPAEATDLDALRRLADERAYADKTSRERRAPNATGVARAGEQVPRRPGAKVARRERRRRSISDMGLLAMSNDAVGLVYVALFAQGEPHRLAMGLILGAGLLFGLFVVIAADRLSRSAVVGKLMLLSAVLLFSITVSVPALDGGVASAVGLGMLAPMPLVALGARIRFAVPALTASTVAYLTVAAWLGAPSVWYVVMHLVGMLTASAICAAQGRTAAGQRTLLTTLSKVDPLTDALNRRGFEERFDAELEHADRTGRVLSLLVLDLDGFKKVNDTAGHAAGDDLLRWVATTLRTNLHPHDVVGRLGGDEFVVVLRSASADATTDIADRLRTALAERTPVSVGSAVLGRDGTDFRTLYAHADAELYAEKETRTGGRRRARSTAVTGGV